MKKKKNDELQFLNSSQELNSISSEAPSIETGIDELLESCAISFSQEDAALLTLCANLANDIINNPDIAASFAEDPTGYVNDLGINYVGDFDLGLIQLAQAASNQEIKDAIMTGDTSRFIHLCMENNLISIPSGFKGANIEELFVHERPLREYLEECNYNQETIDLLLRQVDHDISVEAVLVVYTAGILFVAEVVAAFLGAIVSVVVYVLLETPISRVEMNQVSPLNLWLFSPEVDDVSQIPINEWIEEQYHQIDSLLQEFVPAYQENVAIQEDFEKIIKANLVAQQL